ncbi:RloB family protein [Sinomonas sp. G460-2]|uniref:RloB family protein n=1 Tax=Sinomonas sp. G460-2 TaxID=3393464 RepID=UPI0039F0F82C
MLGGIRTERQYFEYVKGELRTAGIDIELVAEGWTPMKLYEHAIDLRDRDKRDAKKSGDSDNVYDEVWVVSDVDEFVDELKQVKERARGTGVRLAITNPCFEAWLSMHVDGSAAKLDRHQAQDLAKRQGLVDADKVKNIIIDKLRGKFDVAATHARRHAAAHESAKTVFPHDVPASDVDLLVGGLRDRALRSNPNLKAGL